MIRNGDDLEDDFELDEIVALSDGEQEPLDVEDEFVPDEPENLDATVPAKPVPSSAAADAVTSKKRKRREKEKERKVWLHEITLLHFSPVEAIIK
jgi:protein CMS1